MLNHRNSEDEDSLCLMFRKIKEKRFMKGKRILAIIIAITMAAAMLLTGCGKKEVTLESYLNDNEEVKAQLDDALSSNEQSGLNIEIKGNDIIYSFDLSSVEGLTDELAQDSAVKEALEAGMEEHADDFKKVATQMASTTELSGIRVIVNYMYKDEVLATGTYEADSE